MKIENIVVGISKINKYQAGFFILSVAIFVTICGMVMRMYKIWPNPTDLLDPFAVLLCSFIFLPLLVLLFRTVRWTCQNRYFTRQQFICRVLGVLPIYLVYSYWIRAMTTYIQGSIPVYFPFYLLSIPFIPALCRTGYYVCTGLYSLMFSVEIIKSDNGD